MSFVLSLSGDTVHDNIYFRRNNAEGFLSSASINATILKSGFYFLILNSNNKRITSKFIKKLKRGNLKKLDCLFVLVHYFLRDFKVLEKINAIRSNTPTPKYQKTPISKSF